MADAAFVVVLGDVGRSPRMQYHAVSLAQHYATVYLVGYRGERCITEVEENERIVRVLMTPDLLPRPRARALYIASLPFKAIALLVQLLFTLLFQLPRPGLVLVQNPPAIPSLLVVWLVRLVRGCSVVVDWHNLGFTVLEHSMGARNILVTICRYYELLFSRMLDGHLCVTRAMAEWLERHFSVKASVLYDRPPAIFRRLTLNERHSFFLRLEPHLIHPSGKPLFPSDSWADGGTPFTCIDRAGRVTERRGRPRLLVSSTSWTADEDFGLLLEALQEVDSAIGEEGLGLVVLITGKGPLKAHYEARVCKMALRRVAVAMLWLEPNDYPQLLGSCDLGVCLHTSTSGLDLPMKVLDMFGSSLPVCAAHFQCIGELVEHGANGLVFNSRQILTSQLLRLLSAAPPASIALEELQRSVEQYEARRPRWQENWQLAALPLISALRAADPAQEDAWSLASIGRARLLVAVMALALALWVAVFLS